jgi:aminoglycoside 3-N-acetyltransferase
MKIKIKDRIKKLLLRTIWKYDKQKLSTVLASVGICKGDSLMVHSTWLVDNGFNGSAKDFIDCLKDTVTEDGRLFMMSMPYHNQSTKEYLTQKKLFKVRRSPSQVGLLSEVFRRGKEVVRSVNSAHPFLAWGKEKEEFIAGHEHSNCSFGKDSPFAKLESLDCKILLIDTAFNSITYNHYLESLYEERFPVALFDEHKMSGEIIDNDGNEVGFSTRVLSKQSSSYRIDDLLEDTLDKQGKIQRFKVGNTNFTLVKVIDLVDVAASSIIF